MEMTIGAQLFTLRDFVQNEADLAVTLKRVAKMGYTVVQVSGLGPIAPEKVRELCDENNLKIVLTHNNADKLRFDTEAVIRENQIMGCKYVGMGCMPARYCQEGWIQRFVEDYKPAVQKIADAGMRFMYHNHAFDFRKLKGKRQIEYLLEGFTPEEMGLTLDTFWFQWAGCDLYQWAEILKDRIPCVHLKDMSIIQKAFDNTIVMMPVGEGNVNFEGFLAHLKKLGGTEYLLVEQDDCLTDPFECMQTSYNNLKAMGY